MVTPEFWLGLSCGIVLTSALWLTVDSVSWWRDLRKRQAYYRQHPE